MFFDEKQASNSSGFALLVVLATLSILTLLFAVSTRLSLAHIQNQSTEMLLSDRSALNIELLALASERLSIERETEDLVVSFDDQQFTIRVVDAGGLVDLNTAAPPLLDAYLSEVGLSSQERERFRTWRQSSKRLLRLSDLGRVSQAADLDVELLEKTATVYSGRRGVSVDEAPAIVTETLSSVWQDAWVSAASNANFELFLVEDGNTQKIGTIHVNAGEVAKVLRAD